MANVGAVILGTLTTKVIGGGGVALSIPITLTTPIILMTAGPTPNLQSYPYPCDVPLLSSASPTHPQHHRCP